MLNNTSKGDNHRNKNNDAIQTVLAEVRKYANTMVPLGRVVLVFCVILPVLVQMYESTGLFDPCMDMDIVEHSYDGDPERQLVSASSIQVASDEASDAESASTILSAASAFEPTCKDFFSLMTNGAWIPPPNSGGVTVENNETCADVYNNYDALFAAHDEHMQRMGKTLHLFTTWPEKEFDQEGCNLDKYSAIQVHQFDPEQLLIHGGLSQQEINWIKHWKDADGAKRRLVVTRLADVFRLFLAKQYNYAYTDLDMLHLLPYPEVYLNVPNIAAPIWGEEGGAIEIQNSGWCLSSEQLNVMIDLARERMRSKGDEQIKVNQYYYTELGPNLLQHALPWIQTIGQPIRLYYTVSDRDFRPEEQIVAKFEFYKGFVWLHIDKSMRLRMGVRASEQRKLAKYIRIFRRKCKTPSLAKLRIPGVDLRTAKNITIPVVTDKDGNLEEFPQKQRGNQTTKRRGWKQKALAELLLLREQSSHQQQSKDENDTTDEPNRKSDKQKGSDAKRKGEEPTRINQEPTVASVPKEEK